MLLGKYNGKKLTEAFRRLGHEVIPFEQEFVEKDYDTNYLKNLVDFVKVNENVSFVGFLYSERGTHQRISQV